MAPGGRMKQLFGAVVWNYNIENKNQKKFVIKTKADSLNQNQEYWD